MARGERSDRARWEIGVARAPLNFELILVSRGGFVFGFTTRWGTREVAYNQSMVSVMGH